MIAKNFEKIVSALLCLVFVNYSSIALYGYQSQSSATSTDTGSPTEPAAQTAAELESLVAPIALYPDALVAQILSAATFPDQVAIADYWLQENKSLTGSALMQAVDKQTWDPSVKALTQFPSVLENMAKNLSWTSSLGEAFHGQQADVMTAIQTLRAKAKSAGNLKTSSQVTVVQQSPQVIVIQPTNPQVVYVPVYNPAVVYGYPYVVPAYTYVPPPSGAVVAAGIIGFGAGIAVGAMMSGGGGCCSWGYSSWNCGWHGTAVVYHGGAYYGNSAWHGGYYNGGYHNSYGYNNSYNHNNYNNYNHSNYNNNYKNNGNTYNRNVSGNTVNVNKQSAQNFDSSHSSASNSWAQHSSGSAGKSSAFSGMSGHSGGFGDSGGGGWSSRAQSSRGWGSMSSSGFSGGRFGGGGGGWGGGGFHGGGGGFRR